MRISVIRPGELGPAGRAAWPALQAQTPSLASPFLSPEFAVAAGTCRPEARAAVLADGPDTVGFFPFEKRRLRVGEPIGAGLSDCQWPDSRKGAKRYQEAPKTGDIFIAEGIVTGRSPHPAYRQRMCSQSGARPARPGYWPDSYLKEICSLVR